MNNSRFPQDGSDGSAVYAARAAPSSSTAALEPPPRQDIFLSARGDHRTPHRLTGADARSPYSTTSDTAPLPMMTSKVQPAPCATPTTTALPNGTILDVVLPVMARIGDKEEARQTLGITMRAVSSSPHSSARLLCLRITDPSDPFLLFELEIREEDYAAFRQRLELRVDFLAFPKYLVSLFQSIADETSPCHVSFVVGNHDGGKGVLRVLEATEFKTVEHVSLILLRQGDVGQKKYLAERFQFFEHACQQLTMEKDEEARHYRCTVSDLRQEVADLTEANARLRDDLKVSKSVSDKNAVTALSEARDAHAHELQQVRERLLRELRELREESTRAQTCLTDDMRTRDEEIRRLRDANRELEGAQASLRSKLSLAEDKVAALSSEVRSLRESNTSLTTFKIDSTRAMSENELNYVSVTERLRAATAALKDKEEELLSLRAHYQQQDDYIRILSTQNDQLQARGATSDKSLEKAHHVIAHQLETIKNLKERYRIALDQVASKEALLQERQLASARAKDELAATVEKLQSLQRQNADLKEQLQRTDAAQERLAQELKQSQAALLHLQRSTSVNGRHWGVFAPTSATGPAARPAAPSSPSAGLYSQFSRHATVHAPYTTAGAPTSMGTAVDTTSPAPALNLFRTGHSGDGDLTATMAQAVYPPSTPMATTTGSAPVGLKQRTADTANRMASSPALSTKDALRAKTFLTEDVVGGTTSEPRSAYF